MRAGPRVCEIDATVRLNYYVIGAVQPTSLEAVGDNGHAYSNEELKKYKNYYAKKMGKEYFFDLFSNASKDHFKYFFKNYQNSKYYSNLKKIYYYLLK